MTGESLTLPPAHKCPTRPQCPCLTSYAMMGEERRDDTGHLVRTLPYLPAPLEQFSGWVSIETLSGYWILGEPISGTILVLRQLLYSPCWVRRSPARDVGSGGGAS